MVTIALPTSATVDEYETIYANAQGDAALIPWADDDPSPALVNWLNAVAPSLVRCGSRVAVVGCGLGADAREVIRRGYDVTAFDCSETAVRWARSLDPVNDCSYIHADLFDMPARWRHRFDLVVEVNTLQSLRSENRAMAVGSIAGLLSAHGHLLVICRCTTDTPPLDDGPPWPLSETELLETTTLAGLVADGAVCAFDDDETPPVRRMRALFRRA